jgi:hypothetical protein
VLKGPSLEKHWPMTRASTEVEMLKILRNRAIGLLTTLARGVLITLSLRHADKLGRIH